MSGKTWHLGSNKFSPYRPPRRYADTHLRTPNAERELGTEIDL